MSEFKAGDQIVMIEPYAYDDIRVVKELLEEGRVCKTTDGRTLRLSLTSGYMVHRIATPEEIAAGHRIDNDLGDDSPIENRISPLCKSKDV
ncbi:hypothetical protein OHW42_06100 [Acinetobacter baumannii]|nr:hypothetical protein [Acinetobacter baumannii]